MRTHRTLLVFALSILTSRPAHGQHTSAMIMRSIAGSQDSVARAARGVLAARGFALEAEKRGKVGKARIPYANLPCEHIRSFPGEFVLQVDLNPRGFPNAKNATLVILRYEETRAVLDARRAEVGDSVLLGPHCMQRFVDQMADSIQASLLSRTP
jgi:hypothetical protein